MVTDWEPLEYLEYLHLSPLFPGLEHHSKLVADGIIKPSGKVWGVPKQPLQNPSAGIIPIFQEDPWDGNSLGSKSKSSALEVVLCSEFCVSSWLILIFRLVLGLGMWRGTSSCWTERNCGQISFSLPYQGFLLFICDSFLTELKKSQAIFREGFINEQLFECVLILVIIWVARVALLKSKF